MTNILTFGPIVMYGVITQYTPCMAPHITSLLYTDLKGNLFTGSLRKVAYLLVVYVSLHILFTYLGKMLSTYHFHTNKKSLSNFIGF